MGVLGAPHPALSGPALATAALRATHWAPSARGAMWVKHRIFQTWLVFKTNKIHHNSEDVVKVMFGKSIGIVIQVSIQRMAN